jgi:hypothetical protein
VPTLVGTTLCARDREKIVALDLAERQSSARPMPADFSGTWKLEPDRSRIEAPASVAGLAASGAPATLHITQPGNGTVIVESQINESHVRIYAPGRRTTTPVTVGPPGSVTTTARWDGPRLVAEGSRETSSGPSTSVTAITETFALSADGRSLTVEVTATSGGEKAVSTAMYVRAHDLGPCKSWPTPCKVPS